MSIIIPILACVLCEALFLMILRLRGRELPKGAALIPYALVAAGVTVFELLLLALGYEQDVLSVTIATAALALGACVFICGRTDKDNKKPLLRRLGLAVLIAAALELSLFSFSTYFAPMRDMVELDPWGSSESYSAQTEGARELSSSGDTAVRWEFAATDVRNVAVTLKSQKVQNIKIEVWARDKNLSAFDWQVYSDEYIIGGEKTLYIPVSSPGMTAVKLVFSAAADSSLTRVALNSPVPLSANLLRLFLMTVLFAAVAAIITLGLHRIEYRPKDRRQRTVAVVAIVLSCVFIICLGIGHLSDGYSYGSLLYIYDREAGAEGRDPYYQQFDALQKGQLNLDISADERLADAGDLAYDSSWRSANEVAEQWDRAYYNGKYYSYFGIAPLILVYYPIYFITGMVPTTALGCMLFAILCVIFGFMLVFRLARTVVKNANYLLTLLAAAALPLASGAFILMEYGDFYSLPKLCALAFMLLFWYLSLAGYERPRRYIFMLCGLCAGGILASRPNLVLTALSLAPLYLGVLVNKEISLKKKLTCAAAFAAPLLAVAGGVLALNAARFGSPLEFGTNYQLTVSNVALNRVTPGFLGLALYYYFIQPARIAPVFPFVSPQNVDLTVYTRYIYITASYGVLNLPLNWSLAAYPALRKRSELRPAYKAVILLCAATAALTAWVDYCLAGVTVSYVCDISFTVAIAAVILLLLTEKSVRGLGTTYKGVYIGCVIALAATFAVCSFLLLSTSPQFIKYHLPAIYGVAQDLFTI